MAAPKKKASLSAPSPIPSTQTQLSAKTTDGQLPQDPKTINTPPGPDFQMPSATPVSPTAGMPWVERFTTTSGVPINTPYGLAVYDASTSPEYTDQEREELLTGELASRLYTSETGKKGDRTAATFNGHVLGYRFNDGDNGQNWTDYFLRSYDNLKKDKKQIKERMKIAKDTPGISTQTGGNSALSFNGGASARSKNALGRS
jgi:hypothetical protein